MIVSFHLRKITNVVEYDCEGCGIHVHLVSQDSIPLSQLCATCAWLCEFAGDLTEMLQMYDKLNKDMENH
jgi:hypothetical protein